MDVSSIYNASNSFYYLIDQYMKLESAPKDRLVDEKSSLNEKKQIFSDFDKVLSKLYDKIQYLNDEVYDRFAAKKSTSSDPDKINVDANYTAVNGNHSLTVERLASSDTRVSDQFTDSGSSFGAFSTDQTFTIEVGHPTDADANNRVSISVTVEASVFSGTDEEVLTAISEAINDAMSQAVTDEEIDSDEVIHSSIVSEETGTSRLVLSSEQNGYTYRMDFGSSTLLDTLGVNAAVQTSGTSGGYVTAIGTGPSDSELNSKFVMSGLTFYRDSNSVNDALTGVTLKFLNTFSQAETVTISTDTEEVQQSVQDFIDAYNDVIDFIKDKSKIDPNTYKRGPLTSDIMYTGMRTELRTTLMGSVASVTNTDYALLYNIGIEADQDGKLKIADADKFTEALEAKSSNVSELFNSTDGVTAVLEDYIKNFVKTGGAIDNSKELLDSEISALDDRIDYMNTLLDKKEQQYIEEFTRLQKTMYTLSNQQSFFSQFAFNFAQT